MNLSAFLSLVFASASLAAPHPIHPFVQNGTPVAVGDPLLRTVVRLRFSNGVWCSASFLSPRTLLTAGHCAENHRASDVTVNALNNAGTWEQRPALALYAHPQFTHRQNAAGDHLLRNDLAIVQIAQPFSFPMRAVHVSAPSAAMEAGTDAAVTDAGYGFYRPNQGDGTVLRWGRMQGHVAPVAQFEGAAGLEQSMTTAGQNVCPGDSGGPVLLGERSSLVQIAVHSLADGCTAESKVTYSTLLWPARSWIRAQVR